jgi:hypothetical protein
MVERRFELQMSESQEARCRKYRGDNSSEKEPMTIGLILKLESAPKGKRLIVCGGRTYGWPLKGYLSESDKKHDAIRIERERKQLFEVLDLLAPIEIAEGEAPGADSLAREWAEARKIPFQRFRALWETEGKLAGPKRNRRMFESFEPDGVVAFLGGNGTRDMENVGIDGGVWLVRVR